ncbi:MAG: leucine-rich repeat domain-containing protein [Ruminococcaceae bacterium]|nr:leucine-rich repeat domain-containing protein [Oscillospiraceae bacterium]
MKKSNLRFIAAILSCVVICSSVVGCSTDEQDPYSDQTQNQTSSQNSSSSSNSSSSEQQKPTGSDSQSKPNDITADAYNEKINYYMDLVEAMQNEILEMKQDHYIEESQYKAKIAELERNVDQLLGRIEHILAGGNISQTGNSSQGNIDHVSKKDLFEYVIQDGKAIITKYTGKETDVTIPASIDGCPVYAIGEEAFKSCYVTSVTLPDSVRTIDWFAFAGCTSLQSVTVPSSVTRVEYGAFDCCPKNMKIYCERGSYMEAYAKSFGLTVVVQ